MSGDFLLNERYRLLELLATGGMGEVWRAEDEALAREVAVKLLRQELVSDDRACGRFGAEARFAAGLRHGGIAQVYDYGEQDGRAYFVMELVPGEPLSAILERTGALTPEATLDLVAQAARALAVAHDHGIVHRDVKPANLMIASDGTVKITDFGIARALSATSSQTQTGMVMGTAHYISPEQASGQEITPASDLYSLGVVAYECLTGNAPFDADTPVGIALKHVRDAPPELPPSVPAGVRSLITALLAKAPAERPAGANQTADRAEMIRQALLLGGDGDQVVLGGDHAALPQFDGGATPDNLTEVPGQRRSALMYTSVTAGVVLLGVIVVGSLWRGFSSAGLVETRSPLPAVQPGGEPPSTTTPTVHPRPTNGRRPIVPADPSTSRPSKTSQKKPTRKPTKETPTAPTPTPAESTTTPPTLSPVPSPSDSGELGSEDKV
ncbi:serine/threonine-protein kinase [Actinomadura rudentiformis]|uniref:non-specific serine/threonine protein kinase n=1 Tax=Actinomadura rudentiformis TaxID=359158 RepID=A0A6H9YPI6_9ACTN|nr:serine/threonine-protein kinase [Actinomadura rudentiformis]KAB2344741.1 serine/threonine protein kinase [Actinomadura rudentiformis]